MSPGSLTKSAAIQPRVASIATRPCLSSASRNHGSHSGLFSANLRGSKFFSSGPLAPGYPCAKSIFMDEVATRPMTVRMVIEFNTYFWSVMYLFEVLFTKSSGKSFHRCHSKYDSTQYCERKLSTNPQGRKLRLNSRGGRW